MIQKLINKLGIKGIDKKMLDEALTHPSYNFEKGLDDYPDYERLEFLGDSVLRLVISEYLYDKYLDYDEGKLTKIRSYMVSDEFLAEIAVKLNISEYINIGEHEEKDGGREKSSILACTMEAVFGAVYKSLGFQKAKECISRIYDKSEIRINNILSLYNSKELLQQYTQKKNKDLPQYRIIKETGKSHNKEYEAVVIYMGEELGSGKGKTKKEAEKEAALNAIKKLNIVKDNINE